jgi:ABC-type lipoprotein release transport system permease subunit
MNPRARLVALAWRNLWRNSRRTAITLVGIAFGTFLAVLFTGMGDAVYSKMIDDSAKAAAGHVTVQHPEYLDLPSTKQTVRGAPAIIDAASQIRGVTRTVPRVTGAAMLATASNSFGAFYVGLDPTSESLDTLSVLDSIAEGEMFETADDEGIILGSTLSSNLGAAVGKKVVYTVTDKHGEIVSQMARVRGIIHTGSLAIDGGLCLLPLRRTQTLLGYEHDEVTQVGVFLADNRAAARVRDELEAGLDGNSGAPAVLTWRSTTPDLAGYIDMERGSTVIMEGFIMVLLAAGIFNTLFVSVMERLHEFGIMRAIGFSSRQLFALVQWESFFLALAGLVLAAVVTAGPYAYFHEHGIDFSSFIETSMDVAGVTMSPILGMDIQGGHLATICGVVVVATMSAGLYPAWRAGRVVPADVIRLV